MHDSVAFDNANEYICGVCVCVCACERQYLLALGSPRKTSNEISSKSLTEILLAVPHSATQHRTRPTGGLHKPWEPARWLISGAQMPAGRYGLPQAVSWLQAHGEPSAPLVGQTCRPEERAALVMTFGARNTSCCVTTGARQVVLCAEGLGV